MYLLNEKVVLGKTIENSIIIANMVVREDRELSVSFDEIAPFEVTEEYLRECFEGYIDDMGDDELLRLLRHYDCPYSELEERVFNHYYNYYGVEGIIDISLYTESFTIEELEEDVYFESWGCGQGDYRKSLIPLNKDFSEKIHDLWDKYHLKEIPKNLIKELKTDIGKYQNEFELDSTIEELAKEILIG